jgi:Arc/MetJ-type ribon-helix-helix transcriptional regulator
VTRKGRMRVVAFSIPEDVLELVDRLVQDGVFRSRSAALRYLITRSLTEEILRVMGK